VMSLPVWVILVLVCLMGGIGALVRHAATVVREPNATRVRWRITWLNMAGTFLAGVFVVIDHPVATALAVGLFGSLTTWSTIAVWLADDLRQRDLVAAVRLVLAHVLMGIPAVLVGVLTGQILF
jgi:fluoride exporter